MTNMEESNIAKQNVGQSLTSEEIVSRREAQIQATKERFIRVLMKQTDMNEEEAKASLEATNYNVPESVRLYMGIEKRDDKKQLTLNQGIIKEIRDVMDDAASRWRHNQRMQERAQMLRNYQYAMLQQQQQTQQIQQIQTIQEENTNNEDTSGNQDV